MDDNKVVYAELKHQAMSGVTVVQETRHDLSTVGEDGDQIIRLYTIHMLNTFSQMNN